MVLVSVGAGDGSIPLPVSHPQTSQVTMGNNDIWSILFDTVTDSDISDYHQHWTLDTLSLH